MKKLEKKYRSPYSDQDLDKVEIGKELTVLIAMRKYIISLITEEESQITICNDSIVLSNDSIQLKSLTPVPLETIEDIRAIPQIFSQCIEQNVYEMTEDPNLSSNKIGAAISLFGGLDFFLDLIQHYKTNNSDLIRDSFNVIFFHGICPKRMEISAAVKMMNDLGIIYAIAFDEVKPWQTGYFKSLGFNMVLQIIDEIEFQKGSDLVRKEMKIKNGEKINAWASNHPHFL
ncbi:MAG: hypothetical protein HQK79_22910 [Desulfobacterales bacterium]|nr:hypothetical protein [Desulfobacterales bacterium]